MYHHDGQDYFVIDGHCHLLGRQTEELAQQIRGELD